MPKITYVEQSFSPQKQALIDQAIAIVTDYKAQGYDLTLRQVYYQFVARDLLPASWADPATGSTNNQRSYKKLGDVINDGRMGGAIDWHAIEDRTREMDGNNHWDNPASIISAVASQYMIDKWEGQEYRPEVWVEKDALEGVVGKICRELDLPFFSCRGYTSQTAMWNAGQRLRDIAEEGYTPVILHFGDHDPSGIDMSRDIEERVSMFMDDHGDSLVFKRLALNMPQVRQYRPPANPAKITDSRAAKYIEEHGGESWELDALDPNIISGIIEEAVKEYRDDVMYQRRQEKQDTERKLLKGVSDKWETITKRMKV